jgi:hypothetical protein
MVLLSPMQSSLPAGWLAFTGRELNPLDHCKRFQITVSSSFSGFILAQGKFHDVPPGVAAGECAWTLNMWLMMVTCPPTAPVRPIAMIKISARPAGSLGKMLHHLREHAEGAMSTFLSQRISPFMALRSA